MSAASPVPQVCSALITRTEADAEARSAACAFALRLATASDAQALADLAGRAFMDTYRGLDSEADLADYVAEHFTPAVMATVLADEQHRVWVAEGASTAGGTTDHEAAGPTPTPAKALLGYAIVSRRDPPACLEDRAALQLWRLYLDQRAIGKGLGAALMQQVQSWAVAAGARTLWLGVYERNVRAVRFYERFGFRPAGTQVFRLAGVDYVDPVYSAPLPLPSQTD